MHHEPTGSPQLSWRENGTERRAAWPVADTVRQPDTLIVIRDPVPAGTAIATVLDGTGLVWRGDYLEACHLLDAMKRRLTRTSRRRALTPADEFRRQRQERAHLARVLNALLVEVGTTGTVDLPRAPDVRPAYREAFGADALPALIPLRQLRGVVGAHRWRHEGIPLGALLGRRIHPHYGVFAPTRTDYLDLVAGAGPPPAVRTCFDIGTGTGVLAALMLQEGVASVVATDSNRRATVCARENLDRLGYSARATVECRDLFPSGRADLVVCNPPWIPGTPSSPLETGVFDRRGGMLARFIRQLPDHLTSDGQAWLVLSDLPELLGLRGRHTVAQSSDAVGLRILSHRDTPSATGVRRGPGGDDVLAGFRDAERVHLWKLGRRQRSG